MPRRCPNCDLVTDSMVCPKCSARTQRIESVDDWESDLKGQVLAGRYRLEAKVGSGGMGAVFRGVQLTTHQVVAVKVMLPRFATDPVVLRRFRREIDAASRLTHPHTVRVLDAGTSEAGHPFLVMEYLEGRTLRKVLGAEGRLPAHRVIGIVQQVAQSLSEAHRVGLVHRDLCPSNIMLIQASGSGDFVKVLDFGIARFVAEDEELTRLTPSGVVIGKPQYLGPECMKDGAKVTSAFDVYALGVIAYECLVGIPPFGRESALGTLMAHVNDPVPPFPPQVSCPRAFRDLMATMLAKDPARRPSALDVARETERIFRAPVQAATEDEGEATVRLDGRQVGRQARAAMRARVTMAEDLQGQVAVAPSIRNAPRSVRPGGELSTGLLYRVTHPHRRAWIWVLLVLGCVGVLGGWWIHRASSGQESSLSPGPDTVEDPAADVVTARMQDAVSAGGSVDTEGAAAGQVAEPGIHCPEGMVPAGPLTEARKDEGGGLPRPFCIETHESPGRGLLPRTGVSWATADRTCRIEGKRLCSRAEWQAACGSAWPYGPEFIEGACNVGSGTVVPSGRYSRCRTPVPELFDLAGNVAEWVREGVLMGGDAKDGSAASCTFETRRFQPSRTTGFRCCADPR